LEVKRQNGHLFFNQEVASRGSIGHRTRWNLGASGRAGEGGTHARGTGEGIRADRADYHQVVGRTTGGYGFMMANQARWPVATMARLLVVSASGYYVWPAREPWKRACSDAVARVHPLTAHVRFLDPLLRSSAAKVCLHVAGTFGWSRNPRGQACRLRATMLRWRCCSS
jgi:hypothetical protein